MKMIEKKTCVPLKTGNKRVYLKGLKIRNVNPQIVFVTCDITALKIHLEAWVDIVQSVGVAESETNTN